MIRKLLLPFIALMLIFIQPSFAAPKPPPEGGYKWDKARVAVQRDQARVNLGVSAQKTYPVSTLDQNGKPINGTRTATSTIKVRPNANKVGKTLMKRAPHTAIGYAVTALLGRAVDWVLDPENNSVKYKDLGDIDEPEPDGYCYAPPTGWSESGVWFPNAQSACADYVAKRKKRYGSGSEPSVFKTGEGKYVCNWKEALLGNELQSKQCPKPEPDPKPVDWIHIPIDTVAEQVIADADSGQAPATQVLSDTALDMFNAGELDSDLDNAADPRQPDPDYDPSGGTGGETDPDGETGGETPDPDPNPEENPDPTPTEWPAFCDWAFPVCDFIEWFKADSEPPPDIPVPEDQQVLKDPSAFDKSYINTPSQCPPDVEKTISVGSNSFSFVIPMTPVCDFGANVINPVLYFIALIQAAFIIGSAFKVG